MLTRGQCISVTITGAINSVRCNVCKDVLEFAQSDAFAPVSIDFKRNCILTFNLKDTDVARVKNPKELVKKFTEYHYGKHK